MVGEVQVGIVAAGIVLFVPMGMAGWHLSRNRMLFFSAALFITLAVGVHLMPYFPNIPEIIIASLNSTKPSFTCLSVLGEVDWEEKENSPLADSNPGRTWRWKNQNQANCGFQKLGRSDALDLLNGSWVAVAGDSEARFFVLSLLDLVLESTESIRADLFRRHSNYRYIFEKRGLKVDFIWAPFAVNLTRVLGDLRAGGVYPDVLVMGTGLWHMLYVTNASHYGEGLRRVKNGVDSLLPLTTSGEALGIGVENGRGQGFASHMFWLGLPTLVNSMLNTEAKRQRMTGEMCDAYAREVEGSRLLRTSGGPLVLLDIGRLSQGCGPNCTEDGMHYKNAVYNAAVQIMLNALLIESQQQPAG